MTVLPAALVWLGLMALLMLEFLLAYVPGGRVVVPFIGVVMAMLVALTFMRLGRSRGLVPIIAVAGVFWLLVLLGLGGMDPFTRHDVPAPQSTE